MVAGEDPSSPSGVRAAWFHRGLGTEVWFRLHGDSEGHTSHALVSGPRGAATALPLTRRESRAGVYYDGRVDLAAFLTEGPGAGSYWRLIVPTPTGTVPVRATGQPQLRVHLAQRELAARADIRDDGDGLTITLAPLPPWAEVERLEFGDGAAHLEVRPVGEAATDGEADSGIGRWQLVAFADGDRPTAVTVEAEQRGTRLRAALTDLTLDAGVWRLALRTPAGRDLPVGRHLDDLTGKDQAFHYPAVERAGHADRGRLRPRYRSDDTLVLEVTSSADDGHRSGSQPPRSGGDTPLKTPVRDGSDRTDRERRPARATRSNEQTPSDALTRVVRTAFRVAELAARATRRRRRRRPADADTIHLLLLNAYGMGGTVRTVWNLAEALTHRSTVQLTSVVREQDEPDLPSDSPVRLVDLHDRRPNAPRGPLLTRGLRAALARRPSVLVPESEPRHDRFSLLTDVLIVTHLWRLPRGVLVTSRPGLNLIAARYAPGRLTLVGQEHLLLSAHRRRLRRQLLADYPRLDALAVLTAEDERDYRERLRGVRPIVRHIPNAVPDVPFPRSDGRARHVVAAGRLAPAKAFHLLIRAFAQVAETHPDWTLRIYGSGPRQRQLERLIVDLGVGDHVHLMGRTQRIWQEMAKGSIFALSSRFEGFGMVLIEAFQCGLPVVSFACPRGPREIVQHEVNGLLVPELDADAFAEALRRMIDDDELRERCAAGALASGEPYAMRNVERSWRQLFQEAVGR